MDYVGKSVGFVGKSVGYAAITHTFQPMKSIRSDVPWYKYIYHAKSRLNTSVWGSLRSPNNRRASEASETLSGLFNRESYIYIY